MSGAPAAAAQPVTVTRRPGGVALVTLAKEPVNTLDLAMWQVRPPALPCFLTFAGTGMRSGGFAAARGRGLAAGARLLRCIRFTDWTAQRCAPFAVWWVQRLAAVLDELEGDDSVRSVIFMSGVKRDVFTAGRASFCGGWGGW